MTENPPEPQQTTVFWHRRLNIGGYHIALQFGRIYGVAIWPRGSWPKTPILYWWSA